MCFRPYNGIQAWNNYLRQTPYIFNSENRTTVTFHEYDFENDFEKNNVKMKNDFKKKLFRLLVAAFGIKCAQVNIYLVKNI